MAITNANKYEFLFDTKGDYIGTGIKNYRTKTIISGNVLEVEVYPIWDNNAKSRKAIEKLSSEAQKKQNEKIARKKLTRKINANFTSRDIHVTLTYTDDNLPDKAQARKDIQNYFRRIKTYRRNNHMPELKYIYVIEHGKNGRVHHHIIMSNMDRDIAEKLWGKGYANADRLQPTKNGLEALSRYITKEHNNGKKQWCCSKNLSEHIEYIADKKISKRKAEQMCIDFETAPAVIFSNLYPGYDFVHCDVKISEFVSGVYIYVRMIRHGWEKS
jgi:hypothetical protein